MIENVLKTIKLLFETILYGAEEAARKARPYASFYVKGLLLLFLSAIVFPAIVLIAGIVGGWSWLSALSGILWAVTAFLLMLWALPIGFLIETLRSGVKGSGERYIRGALGIVVVGLCISLFASIIPIKENISMLPLLVLAAVVLGIFNVWLFSRKVISFLVGVIFIILILSFYFPMSFRTLGERISDLDVSIAEPKRLYPTYRSVEMGKFRFFRGDGKPKVWYYRTGDGRFELFDRKGHHPIFREVLKPVNHDIAPQILQQLKENEERRLLENQTRNQTRQDETGKMKQEEGEKSVKVAAGKEKTKSLERLPKSHTKSQEQEKKRKEQGESREPKEEYRSSEEPPTGDYVFKRPKETVFLNYGTYEIEKKIGTFAGNGIDIFLKTIEVAQDGVRVYLLFEHYFNTDVWIGLKKTDEGISLVDNFGLRHELSDPSIMGTRWYLGPNGSTIVVLSLSPLRERTTWCIFRGSFSAFWADGRELNSCKVRYDLVAR